MKIIAFAGMPFSGKTEAVKIAKDMGIPVIRMGNMVWEEVKNRGLEINDNNVGNIANQMRKHFGKDIWAKKTIQKLKSLDEIKTLVIDGVRNIEEIDAFKKELGEDFMVVAVEVGDELRFKRALNRDRDDDITDIKKIKERDQRELSWGLDVVIASADVIISNEGSINEFQRRVKEVLQKNMKTIT
ncbi:MAG: AAA family ATPase [Petrotogales bacterium]